MAQILSTLEKAIGTRLRVTTVNGEKIEGVVYTFDSNLKCLVLQEISKTNPKRRDIRVLRSSSITEVTVIKGDPEEALMPSMNSLPPVDWKKQQAKEKENINRLKDEFLRSPEAVAVFAALSKTYPCHWDDDKIIVMEILKLSPPYRPEDLASRLEEDQTDAQKEATTRVRKLLERNLKAPLASSPAST